MRILAWRSAGAELSQGQKGGEKDECELASCLDMILSFYSRPSIRMGGIHCLTMDSLRGLPLRRDEPEASRRELPTGGDFQALLLSPLREADGLDGMHQSKMNAPVANPFVPGRCTERHSCSRTTIGLFGEGEDDADRKLRHRVLS